MVSRAIALSYQILKSGNSAGANYEEADDGSSPSDVLAKRKITLRELKETRFRMRVLRHSGLMLPEQDPCWELGVGRERSEQSWELSGERSELLREGAPARSFG